MVGRYLSGSRPALVGLLVVCGALGCGGGLEGVPDAGVDVGPSAEEECFRNPRRECCDAPRQLTYSCEPVREGDGCLAVEGPTDPEVIYPVDCVATFPSCLQAFPTLPLQCFCERNNPAETPAWACPL